MMFQWLEYQDWLNAINLMDYQFTRKNHETHPNRHFNTPSLYIIESEWETVKESLKKENYFQSFIKTGYILSDEKKAYSILYPGKKSFAKYRNSSFLSLYLRIFYYAVGLHLCQCLPLPLNTEYFRSFYGGELTFNRNGELSLKPESVYYKNHYRLFFNSCIKLVEDTHASEVEINKSLPEVKQGHARCVIKLDLENFYDQISITKLFSFLDQEHTHKQFGFSEFLNLVTHTKQGLPQTCNDIVASRLSCFYLHKLDNLLDEYLSGKFENNYYVLRYCDDLHIFIDYQEEDTLGAEQIAYETLSKCKNILYSHYQLKMNSKTVYYDLTKESERKDYIDTLKNLSQINDIVEDKKYIFEEWKKEFESACHSYLKQDLIKGSPEPTNAGTNDNLKRIYHEQFRLDLKSHYQEKSIPKGILEMLINVYNNRTPHLHDKAKLFTFFGECFSEFPEYMQRYFQLEEFQDETTFALTLFDFTAEFSEEAFFKGRLKKTPLYKSMTKSQSSYSYDFINTEVISDEELSYLSVFTLQRRNAEQQGIYSQAVSFLNSELCVLLALLKIPVDENRNGDTRNNIQDSLRKYKGASGTILNNIAKKRNTLDVSHNKNAFPDVSKSPERTISESEYTELKNKVPNALKRLMQPTKRKP
ncbi:MAG: reverse transcriptase domain-containing protein [Vampirovibrionales bacterium]